MRTDSNPQRTRGRSGNVPAPSTFLAHRGRAIMSDRGCSLCEQLLHDWLRVVLISSLGTAMPSSHRCQPKPFLFANLSAAINVPIAQAPGLMPCEKHKGATLHPSLTRLGSVRLRKLWMLRAGKLSNQHSLQDDEHSCSFWT